MGHPGQANVRKSLVRFLGVWRRARVCVRVSYATTPERNQPHVPRWSIRPTCEFFRGQRPGPARAAERSRATADTTKKSSRIELAHLQKPRVRMQARPLDLRPPVSPLVVAPPPVTSRRVVCRVVAKATVEVGLAIAVLITHVTAARRRARRRADGAASVGVVIITSVAARCGSFVVRP